MIDQDKTEPGPGEGSPKEAPGAPAQSDFSAVEVKGVESEPRPPLDLSPEEHDALVSKQLQAVARIYQLHWQVLLSFARQELTKRRVPDADYSAEDVLQTGIGMLVRQIIAGNIDQTEDESGALRVLRRLIQEKVINRSVYLHALKRNPVRKTQDFSFDRGRDGNSRDVDDDEQARVADRLDLNHCGVPPADVQVIAADLVAHLLARLNEEQRVIARMRLDSHTIPDIASQLGLSQRTVERRLEEVRDAWARSGLLDGDPARRKSTMG